MGQVINVGRPVGGDIIDVILEDHRIIERLLREMRDDTSDRGALREAFAHMVVAHAEAEESVVYPKLRKRSAISADDAHHGKEEHAEGHEALLALLELKGTDTKAFDTALEELSNVMCHHLVEEELSILNAARDELGERARGELGEAFAKERNRLFDDNCGTLTNVRKIVAAAKREDLISDEDHSGDE